MTRSGPRGYLPLQKDDIPDNAYLAAQKGAHPTLALWSAILRRKLNVGCHGIRSICRALGAPGAKKRVRSSRLRQCVRIVNWVILSAMLLLFVSLMEALLFPAYTQPPAHYQGMADRVRGSGQLGRGNPNNEKIYIASNILREERVRGPWGKSMVELVNLLGPDNVFVSIFENDSGPEVARALRGLSDSLTCNTSIISNEHVGLETLPSVILPNGEPRVKRINYLAEVRNKLLRPLEHPDSRKFGESLVTTSTRYDKILFLNDIYFDPLEALQLLFSTNYNPQTQRAEYGAACAVHFTRKAMIYDSFVVRDLEGYELGLMYYPWFTSKGRGESRRDVLAGKDAVRVRSCWGGMAAYDATPFLRNEIAASTDTSAGAAPVAEPKDNTTTTTTTRTVAETRALLPPLRFRHSPELFWESSECCLLNADLAVRPDVTNTNIYLNPYVRVTSDEETWLWLPFFRRYERGFRWIQYLASILAYPEYNPRRTEEVREQEQQWSVQPRWVFKEEVLNGERVRAKDLVLPEDRSGRWEMTKEVVKPGGFCGQRRLFVMKQELERSNRDRSASNWETIPLP